VQILNASDHPREIVATGQIVNPGETVEVDDDLGASLCEQPDNWHPKKTAASGKEN